MESTNPRILVIGAHPDDPDFFAGGTAAQWCQLGYVVKLVSLTDGSAGHHLMPGPGLAKRRKAEANAAAAVIGATYHVGNVPDGELQPTLEARREVIQLIRQFNPDLVLTHRPNDYHPDHRYTSQLVQDAAYMMTVPHVCPDVPALRSDPVIMYLADRFQKPVPFNPSIVVQIDEVFEPKLRMLACHESQVFEWLPYSFQLGEVPDDDEGRAEFLRKWVESVSLPARYYADLFCRQFGATQYQNAKWIEAFELCEYGGVPDSEWWSRLFPFAPVVDFP